ncbi:hypothetical protein Sango_2116100 [Sesamum angolense]|uniref:RNase H type-1 domain-containing protein n=1 Tax=Sesamum angolense TaxID=2727404 RepID=A0AAE2BM85_9LAMI|nr:hypothetical protein Sango_2116100 [Sesamum angolense]
MDATAVITLLQSRVSGKWEVQHLIMRILHLQQLLVVDVQHVFREANGAADHLANEPASLQLTRVLCHNDITDILRGQEAEWLRNLVGDIPLWGSSVPVSLHCDSQAAIGIANNYAYNGKRRHIRLRHSAVKELLKNKIISLDYVRSERNLADPLTKGLTRRIILKTSRAMGLKPLEYGDNYM